MTDLSQFEQTETGLLVRAPAKINLSLLITGKRADGYHGIETIMAKINWYDELLFEHRSSPGIELVCQGPCWAPDGKDNLVYQACEMLMEMAKMPVPLRITLTKNIPAGTGLGSASSDAAAALIGLNRFAGLNQPHEVLNRIAAALGSDVNFFLGGPLAFCTGRGEKIEPIFEKCEFCVLLLIPNVTTSTKRVYENYRHKSQEYRRLSAKINPLRAKKSIDSIAKICANMLESSCFGLHPELERLKQACERLCGVKVCLSGSGSALYLPATGHQAALVRLQDQLKNEYSCESRIVNNNRW
jgi:4-diphosphocytidyl-2-C-methyl-D-erythritol kinase